MDTFTTTFNIQDTQFFVGNQTTPVTAARPSYCTAAAFLRILFTKQKNIYKGKTIGNGATVQPRACGVTSTMHRVSHLQQHGTSG